VGHQATALTQDEVCGVQKRHNTYIDDLQSTNSISDQAEILKARRVASEIFLANSGAIMEMSVNRYSTARQLRDPAIADPVEDDEDEDAIQDDATSNGPAVANEAALYAKVISAIENSHGLRPAAGASSRVSNSEGNAVALVCARWASPSSQSGCRSCSLPHSQTWALPELSGQGKR
jgi:hypothetical protein